MELDRVDIVLVRPSRPENVAAACRAMKNMGLRRLTVVGWPGGLDHGEGRRLAYGAWDVLDGAVRCASLLEAVASATVVVGTTGRPAAGAWHPRRLAVEAGRRLGDGRLAVVFGPEATGLTRVELDLCHARLHVPTDSAQPSLNLAQAVLLVAYELRSLGEVAASATPRAPAGDVESALAQLREALLSIGYLNPANPDAILAEWRGLLSRAGPSPREVALVRGLARQIAWAARRIAGAGEGGG